MTQSFTTRRSSGLRIIFVNLPGSDIAAAMRCYDALGFTNEPRFTDETAACMVLSDTIRVMLLTYDKWKTFTTRPIPPSDSSEVMLADRKSTLLNSSH